MDFMNFPEVQEIFSRFRDKNLKIYCVGGAVRDSLLEERVNDIDFATDALPEEIESLFEKTIRTGKAFGTITVYLNNKNFEITTFRTESDYRDKRKPDKVSFSKSLTEDLSRRDFTINGLAVTENGEIIDHFEGLKDLENKVIRTIGDPAERFEEDELRKWRTFRFAAQKGFDIDPDTLRALINDSDTSFISIERIRDEFFKFLCSDHLEIGAELILKTSLLDDLFKRIGLESKRDSHLNFGIIEKLPKEISLRLTALFLDYKPYKIECALINLKVPNELKKQVLKFNNAHNEINSQNYLDLINHKKLLASLGKDNFYSLLKILLTEAELKKDPERIIFLKELSLKTDRILKEKEPLSRSDLALKGDDLLSLGLKGKAIGKILEYLLEQVYLDPTLNTKETLTKIVENEKANFTNCN